MDDINVVQLDDFRKQRIGVLCLPGLETFLPPIVEYLKKTYSVRTYYGRTLLEIESLVEWADIVWIEWCNELAVETTNRIPSLVDKKVLIRLHSYEALANYVQAVKWSVVDSLIFVAEHIKNIVCQYLPSLPDLVDIYIVHNGV